MTPIDKRRGLRPRFGIVAVLLLFGLLSTRAFSHQLDQGVIYLKVYDDVIEGDIEIAVNDLNTALGLEFPTDGSVTEADLQPVAPRIKAYLAERISVTPDGAVSPFQLGEMKLATIPLAQYAVVQFEFRDLAHVPQFVDVRYDVLFDKNDNHRGFLVNFHNWKTGTFDDESNIALIFTPSSTQQRLDLSTATVWHGISAMIGQGVHHIWIGIDHILFLLALLLPSVVKREHGRWTDIGGFRPALLHVVAIVTLFTVAHTITLSAGALETVSLSSRVVESIIALSIAVAALDIIIPIFGRRIWLVVFGFGLFHGFGFASVMSDIGIPPKYLVHSLIGFNVGVELGQVAIVCVIFPVLFLLRRTGLYTRLTLPYGASLLILVAMYWFVERAFEVDLPAGAMLQLVVGKF